MALRPRRARRCRRSCGRTARPAGRRAASSRSSTWASIAERAGVRLRAAVAAPVVAQRRGSVRRAGATAGACRPSGPSSRAPARRAARRAGPPRRDQIAGGSRTARCAARRRARRSTVGGAGEHDHDVAAADHAGGDGPLDGEPHHARRWSRYSSTCSGSTPHDSVSAATCGGPATAPPAASPVGSGPSPAPCARCGCSTGSRSALDVVGGLPGGVGDRLGDALAHVGPDGSAASRPRRWAHCR